MLSPYIRTLSSAGALALVLLAPRPAHAQALDEQNRVELSLHDGTKVVALGSAVSAGQPVSRSYYYLPTGLRLATRPDGTPEFLFLKYTTDEAATEGGIQGGLLHALFVWGLTEAQMTEAQTVLATHDTGARLMGAAQVEPEGQNGTFRIISATLSNSQRARSIVMSGKVATLPGGRMALAADLDPQGAQLIAATLDSTRSITDVTIELSLAYTAMVPAAKGEVRTDWSRLETHHDELVANYKRTHTSTLHSESCFLFICNSSSKPEYSYSYDQMRSQVSFLFEQKVIQFNWEENVSDDRVTTIRDAFTKFFLGLVAEPNEDRLPPVDKEGGDSSRALDSIRIGDRYHYAKRSTITDLARKLQVFRLDTRLAFKRPVTLTGNLGSWYNSVRDNPKCVASVNLNNPFYARQDVRFRVDFDAPKELFSSVFNYVTVTVRKDRQDGVPFERSVTIDEDYVKKNGVLATMTYARGEDRDPSLFRYKVQWSMKGGDLYPATANWESSQGLAAIALAPPVVPRKIELEGNLQELAASGITRVTAQIRYRKFGREVEQNIQLPVGSGEALVSGIVFPDRTEKGYAYRLVLNHKTEGRLALPWSAQVGDDYIYATVPTELLVKTEVMTAARTAATETVTNVLDQFRDVLGGSHQ
ncbi:MAG: hypothetical protein ABI679_04325 [Gemmatimonadota bacterium]